jgi:ATP-dependent helicase/DNAse subunit B
MIKIRKLSPSSVNTFDMCQMKWFLQYVLGYREPSGKAATIGSCCHYILEIVAQSKILVQDNKKWKKDKVVGRITREYDLDDLCEKAFEYFKKENPHLSLGNKELREVKKNIQISTEHELFPGNHAHIIEPERYFEVPLDFEWAKYKVLEDGELVEKTLYINGIIDLIYQNSDGQYNCLDYKFGRAYDWAKGYEKDYSNLTEDIQLCLYYYALTKQFPDQEIVINLWYVKAEKLFTLYFGQENIDFAMNKLRDTFDKIKYMDSPMCRYGKHCNFCSFKKTSFADWGSPGLDISHNSSNRFKPINGSSSICDATRNFINYRGLNLTLENVKHKGTSK